MTRRLIRSLLRDETGGAILEFGLVGPAFLALLLGGLQFGLQMQNMNALRGAGVEASRKILVYSQNDNDLTEAEMQAVTIATARSGPYYLDLATLNVEAEFGTSTIPGAKLVNLTIEYEPTNFISFFNEKATHLVYKHKIYLAD